MPSGYNYEVEEPGSITDVLSGKESVKIEHQLAIPTKTIVLFGVFTILTTLIVKVLTGPKA